MKILLFGSTGFIGSQLKTALLEEGHEVAGPRIEIRNFDEVLKTIEKETPDYVINTAGITGKPNVDWCETHPLETFTVNVAGAINVAAAAREHGLTVAYISSGCVYDGNNKGRGYSEEDEPNFFGSLYSRSRFVAEKALREFPNVLHLRIRIPIMGTSHPKNLIDKLLRYPKMINKVNSCTVMEDFIPAAIQLIEMGETGVFNMCNPGPLDHEHIMKIYQEVVDPYFIMNFMDEGEQEKLCARRSNCVLTSEKRESLGVIMPKLETSLRKILTHYTPPS